MLLVAVTLVWQNWWIYHNVSQVLILILRRLHSLQRVALRIPTMREEFGIRGKYQSDELDSSVTISRIP